MRDVGLGIGAFALMSWMAVTIVKDISADQKLMIQENQRFQVQVSFEHQQAQEQHKRMIEAQKGIALTLGRINGYKH